MAGTLTVYHSPMRPIKVKPKKIHFKNQENRKKETFRVNTKSPNVKG